jgi:hypothetical protein
MKIPKLEDHLLSADRDYIFRFIYKAPNCQEIWWRVKGKLRPPLTLTLNGGEKLLSKPAYFPRWNPPSLSLPMSVDWDSGLCSESVLCSQTPCLDGRPSAPPVTWGRAIRRWQDNFAFKFCWWLWWCRMRQIQSSVLQAYQHSCVSCFS